MPLPTPEECRKLSQVDPEVEAIMKSPEYLSQPQADFSDATRGIMQLRTFFDKLKNVASDPRVTTTQRSYPTRDSTQKLYIYKPATASKDLSVLVWYHGGGGCVGSPDMMPVFCRNIALEHDCIVISPGYRLGPEHKFPTGLLDCWDALSWVAENAASEGADLSRGFLVGGESYGALITAFVMLQARDKGLKFPLSGAILSVGSYVNPYNVPEQYSTNYLSRFDPVCLAAPGLNEESKKAYDLALQPDYNSPIYRATLWPTGHTGLPRTYIQTCGMDINRDEAFVYQDMLERSGVETKLDVYPGCPHCFGWLFPNAQVTQKWQADTHRGIEWLFGRTS